MNDIIKVKCEGYDRYEEVLFRRDKLLRDAEHYNLAYIREFGDLIEQSFRLKIECIEKKKKIAFCQARENLGKEITKHDLENYIDKEMAKYHEELKKMVDDIKTARAGTLISDKDAREIKKIYHELAKLIHPDIHPEFAEDEQIRKLWQAITVAYRCNQLDELKTLDFSVKKYLRDIGVGGVDIDLPDIEARIEKTEKEIDRVLSTTPYTYKFVLEDPAAAADRRKSLHDDIQSYRRYSEELDGVLRCFEIKEMLS